MTISVTVRVPVNDRLSVVKLGEWKAILRFLSAQEVSAPNTQALAPTTLGVQGSTVLVYLLVPEDMDEMFKAACFEVEISKYK